MTYPNIPNEVRRFNGTAEIPYAIDYEFNDLQHAHAVNSKQKLFIGGNSFPGTTIVTIQTESITHQRGEYTVWHHMRNH